MRLALVLTFILSMLLLRHYVYRTITPLTILQLTCILIVVVIAVDYGAPAGAVEFYTDAQQEEANDEKLRFLSDLMKKEEFQEAARSGVSGTPTRIVAATRAPTAPTTTRGLATTATPAPVAKTATTTPPPKAGDDVEDITVLMETSDSEVPLSFYFSVYSTESYVGSGHKEWLDIAGSIPNLSLTFERVPSILNFDTRNGLFLGDNRVLGPLCSELGLDSGAYTLFFAVNIQDLVASDVPMDILKLFGNTLDNNALTVRMSEVDRSNVIQTAKLSVKVGGSPNWFYCKINDNPNLPFDKLITYLFAVVCHHSYAEVFMASSLNHHFMSILKYDLNSSAKLSNKELEINSSRNFNAYLKAFGGYNTALQPTDLTRLSEHVFSQERKKDRVFVAQRQQLNSMEAELQSIQQCPYDTNTCAACEDVPNWASPRVFMDASPGCMSEINNFCTKNPSHSMCDCWQKSSKGYNSRRCVNLRRYMTNGEYHDLQQLDKEALQTIKKLYKLQEIPPVTTSTPPPSTPTPTLRPTTRPPTTAAPTLPPIESKDDLMKAMMNATAKGEELSDEAMLLGMLANRKKKSLPPHSHKVLVPEPLADDPPPRGFFGWLRSLFSSDVSPADFAPPKMTRTWTSPNF